MNIYSWKFEKEEKMGCSKIPSEKEKKMVLNKSKRKKNDEKEKKN